MWLTVTKAAESTPTQTKSIYLAYADELDAPSSWLANSNPSPSPGPTVVAQAQAQALALTLTLTREILNMTCAQGPTRPQPTRTFVAGANNGTDAGGDNERTLTSGGASTNTSYCHWARALSRTGGPRVRVRVRVRVGVRIGQAEPAPSSSPSPNPSQVGSLTRWSYS